MNDKDITGKTVTFYMSDGSALVVDVLGVGVDSYETELEPDPESNPGVTIILYIMKYNVKYYIIN